LELAVNPDPRLWHSQRERLRRRLFRSPFQSFRARGYRRRLHRRLRLGFGLSFSLVGAIVACFGIGGLLFAGLVKLFVYRLGQTGLAIGGGLILAAAYTVLGTAPMATTAIGLGFYMLHNTLQTNATQMTPQARGTAVGLFSSALYVGQTPGVAAGALIIDRAGARPLFLATATGLPLLAVWFVRELKRYRRVD
jgi:MFS transporter, YNFM family, putative membrane transport protein